jgi:hypothetical protein
MRAGPGAPTGPQPRSEAAGAARGEVGRTLRERAAPRAL